MKSILERLLKLESSISKDIFYHNHEGKLCRLNLVQFLLAALVFDILENQEVTGMLVDEKAIFDDIPISEYAKIADQLDALPSGYRGKLLIQIMDDLRARSESQ